MRALVAALALVAGAAFAQPVFTYAAPQPQSITKDAGGLIIAADGSYISLTTSGALYRDGRRLPTSGAVQKVIRVGNTVYIKSSSSVANWYQMKVDTFGVVTWATITDVDPSQIN